MACILGVVFIRQCSYDSAHKAVLMVETNEDVARRMSNKKGEKESNRE